MGRDILCYTRSLRTPSILVLKTSGMGHSQTAVDNLFQCLIIPSPTKILFFSCCITLSNFILFYHYMFLKIVSLHLPCRLPLPSGTVKLQLGQPKDFSFPVWKNFQPIPIEEVLHCSNQPSAPPLNSLQQADTSPELGTLEMAAALQVDYHQTGMQ